MYESTFESTFVPSKAALNIPLHVRVQCTLHNCTKVQSTFVLSKVLSYESTHILYSTFGSKFYEGTKVLSYFRTKVSYNTTRTKVPTLPLSSSKKTLGTTPAGHRSTSSVEFSFSFSNTRV